MDNSKIEHSFESIDDQMCKDYTFENSMPQLTQFNFKVSRSYMKRNFDQ